MKKVCCIFGTRPEAIKMAPLIKLLKKEPSIQCNVCVTAQHREMLDQVLTAFEIKPDVDFNVMRPNQTLGQLTSHLITLLDNYLSHERPDVILIQGDTTTVFASALVAFYHHIEVGHLEAGLRTNNLNSPWPEEGNRQLTTRLTRWHFAPTEQSRLNLLQEGVSDKQIYVTGNTVIDALHLARARIRVAPPVIEQLPIELLQSTDKIVLITGHRRENFGIRFEKICHAIRQSAEMFPDVHFIYPVHLNPSVINPVTRILGSCLYKNIHLIKPLDYLGFVHLLCRSTFVLTDSGGIQEEAPSIGKPVLVMRDTTERPEAIEAGGARLVGTDPHTICNAVKELLTDTTLFQTMSSAHSPYGDGHAAEHILKVILQ